MPNLPTLARAALLLGFATTASCGDDVKGGPEPTPPDVRAIIVTPANTVINFGESTIFRAAIDVDPPLSSRVSWVSSDTSVATIGLTASTVDALDGEVVVHGKSRVGESAICATAVAESTVRTCAMVTIRAPGAQPDVGADNRR